MYGSETLENLVVQLLKMHANGHRTCFASRSGWLDTLKTIEQRWVDLHVAVTLRLPRTPLGHDQ